LPSIRRETRFEAPSRPKARRGPLYDSIEIIGHRGYSARAPENTLPALDAALEAGADAVEWDIHTAACGTPVLFHDAMLSRTTNGVGPLQRRTLEQLRSLDAGRWFSEEFAGVRIPSLAEAFDHVRGRVGRVYAEVKGYRELEDVDRMLHVAEVAGMLDDTVFISMNWTLLDRMRGREPSIAVGYIVEEGDRAEDALDKAAGDTKALVDFRADLLVASPSLAERARAEGTDLCVWTVDDPDNAARLLDLGVHRFTTNQVAALHSWRADL
jgi:glycerophosphoryl diester phosphodiesterase